MRPPTIPLERETEAGVEVLLLGPTPHQLQALMGGSPTAFRACYQALTQALGAGWLVWEDKNHRLCVTRAGAQELTRRSEIYRCPSCQRAKAPSLLPAIFPVSLVWRCTCGRTPLAENMHQGVLHVYGWEGAR